MSYKGDFLIKLLRSNKPIQNPENPMHQLLNFGLGGFLDFLEEYMYVVFSKINIFNNIPDNDTEEWEKEITAGMLKLYGDQIRVYREPEETNNEYRNRLLSYKIKDCSLGSIINLITSLLNIPTDSFTIKQEFINNDPLEFGDIITTLRDNTSTDILLSLRSEDRKSVV